MIDSGVTLRMDPVVRCNHENRTGQIGVHAQPFKSALCLVYGVSIHLV